MKLPQIDLPITAKWRKYVLLLAYKSLDSNTDPRLVKGWLKWSGAYLAYTTLRDNSIHVTSLSL